MDRQVYEFVTAQTGEQIVERRKCPDCGEEFAITDKDLQFYDKISPVFDGQKYSIPVPTLCPDCRQQKRLARRNERKLYKRKCDLTGKPIVSIYSPDIEYKIYESKERRGDKRDPMDYAMDVDFNKSFFEQFDELFKKVPKIALNSGIDNENSDFNNYIGSSKNCYLNFGIDNSVNVLYSDSSSTISDSLDVSNSVNIENSGYVWWSGNCVNSFFIDSSGFIRKSCFIKWSKDINNGILCLNIANKSYVYKNKEISKDEFEKLYDETKNKLKTYSGTKSLEKEFDAFVKQFPVLSAELAGSENSYGSLIGRSKDCSFCYSLVESNDCKYCSDSSAVSDCMDIDVSGNGANHLIETLNCYGSSNIYFSESVFENSRNIFYSVNCANNCSNLFGCTGLKSKEYCIFNKQYTRQEYEQLVPKIIENMQKNGERGEFFPAKVSPFGYNETVANEYFTFERDEALRRGFKWQDKEYPINIPDGIEKIKASDLPDNIDNIDDEILKKAIICETSGKPFRLVPMELSFYRKHGIAIPHQHPDTRHVESLKKRSPRKLFLRTCDNCGKQIISVYPQDSDFKVYCEDCYNEEID